MASCPRAPRSRVVQQPEKQGRSTAKPLSNKASRITVMVKQPAPTLGRPVAEPPLVDGVACNAVACANASSTWHWGDVPMRIEGDRSSDAIAHDLAMNTVPWGNTDSHGLDGADHRLAPAIDTTRELAARTRAGTAARTRKLRPLRGLTGAPPQPPPDQRLCGPEKLDKRRVIEGWASAQQSSFTPFLPRTCNGPRVAAERPVPLPPLSARCQDGNPALRKPS
jgi:hypothetical protein